MEKYQKLMSLSTQWRRNLHYLIRVTKHLLDVYYTTPRLLKGVYEVQQAHTSIRLADGWLTLFQGWLAGTGGVTAEGNYEDDPLPDDGQDAAKLTAFVAMQLKEQVNDITGANIEAYTADATALLQADQTCLYLINAALLLDMALEDAQLKKVLPNEGDVEVQP